MIGLGGGGGHESDNFNYLVLRLKMYTVFIELICIGSVEVFARFTWGAEETKKIPLSCIKLCLHVQLYSLFSMVITLA